jgi:hypothetical protein
MRAERPNGMTSNTVGKRLVEHLETSGSAVMKRLRLPTAYDQSAESPRVNVSLREQEVGILPPLCHVHDCGTLRRLARAGARVGRNFK